MHFEQSVSKEILIVRSRSGKNWQDRDKADKVSISFPATPEDNWNVFGGVMKKFERFITRGVCEKLLFWNATCNTFAYDQLKPRVWFTGFRFVACQDFEAINLRFSTFLSFWPEWTLKNTDKITNNKCGVIRNGKLDITIVKFLENQHGQKCETVTLLFIYSKAVFE